MLTRGKGLEARKEHGKALRNETSRRDQSCHCRGLFTPQFVTNPLSLAF